MAPRVVPMIHVPDVRATAAWYASIGFTVERTHEDDGVMSWALLTYGSGEIMLNEGGDASDRFRREVDLYLHVESIESTRARVADRAEVVEEIHDTEYGMRELIVRDPNRFWITFGQPIPLADSPAG